jgi:hypothetical protein
VSDAPTNNKDVASRVAGRTNALREIAKQLHSVEPEELEHEVRELFALADWFDELIRSMDRALRERERSTEQIGTDESRTVPKEHISPGGISDADGSAIAYSPQDFEVVKERVEHEVGCSNRSRGAERRCTPDCPVAALASIKEHTEGLERTQGGMEFTSKLVYYRDVAEQYSARIAELGAGLREIATTAMESPEQKQYVRDLARSLLVITDSGEDEICPTCGSRTDARFHDLNCPDARSTCTCDFASLSGYDPDCPVHKSADACGERNGRSDFVCTLPAGHGGEFHQDRHPTSGGAVGWYTEEGRARMAADHVLPGAVRAEPTEDGPTRLHDAEADAEREYDRAYDDLLAQIRASDLHKAERVEVEDKLVRQQLDLAALERERDEYRNLYQHWNDAAVKMSLHLAALTEGLQHALDVGGISSEEVRRLLGDYGLEGDITDSTDPADAQKVMHEVRTSAASTHGRYVRKSLLRWLLTEHDRLEQAVMDEFNRANDLHVLLTAAEAEIGDLQGERDQEHALAEVAQGLLAQRHLAESKVRESEVCEHAVEVVQQAQRIAELESDLHDAEEDAEQWRLAEAKSQAEWRRLGAEKNVVEQERDHITGSYKRVEALAILRRDKIVVLEDKLAKLLSSSKLPDDPHPSSEPIAALRSLIEDNPEYMNGAGFNEQIQALNQTERLVKAAGNVLTEGFGTASAQTWRELIDAIQPFIGSRSSG